MSQMGCQLEPSILFRIAAIEKTGPLHCRAGEVLAWTPTALQHSRGGQDIGESNPGREFLGSKSETL